MLKCKKISTSTLDRDASRNPHIQIRFSSKAMGSLYKLLCHHSSSSPGLLFDEIRTYLPTRFSSHNFDYIVYKNSDDNPYYSHSTTSALYSDHSTYSS